MQRRVLAFILAASMVMGCITGCGSKGTENDVVDTQNVVATEEVADVEDTQQETETVVATETVETTEATELETEEVITEEIVEETPVEEQQVESVPEVEQPVAESTPVVDEVCPYPLYTIFYDAYGLPYFYGSYGGSANMDPTHYAYTSQCDFIVDQYVRDNFRVTNPDGTSYSMHSCSWKLIGTYSGLKVVVRYIADLNGVRMPDPELRGIPTAGNGIF